MLYAFDPRRIAILLIGGDKTGDDRWYETNVPVADGLYDQCLRTSDRSGTGSTVHDVPVGRWSGIGLGTVKPVP